MFLDSTATSITVDADAGEGNVFTEMVFWDSSTYKNPAKSIDLTSLLNGAVQNEILVINASDVNLSRFDGLFFVELTNNEATPSVQMGIVANLVPYHECMLDKSLAVKVVNCEIKQPTCGNDSPVLFVSTLIESLNTAIIFSLFDEAIKMVETLDELCMKCSSCPDLGDALLLEGYGYRTVNNSVTSI